jgi:ADP-ribose pyrophosphatase YjhB (NUDIX family)
MRKKNIPNKLFKKILRSMPIPCVDIIIKTKEGVVFIKRNIAPYKNKWAFPGGRIIRGESIKEAIDRQASEIGIKVKIERLIGVFPVNFKFRFDISICYLVKMNGGKLKTTYEAEKILVSKYKPSNLGGNYLKMWLKAKKYLR